VCKGKRLFGLELLIHPFIYSIEEQMKRVRFYLPPEITIQDTILNVRRKVKLNKDTNLSMFRRFHRDYDTRECKVYSAMCERNVSIIKPLRSQGVLPGDTLIVLPMDR
jgi:hypothetical protein